MSRYNRSRSGQGSAADLFQQLAQAALGNQTLQPTARVRTKETPSSSARTEEPSEDDTASRSRPTPQREEQAIPPSPMIGSADIHALPDENEAARLLILGELLATPPPGLKDGW